MKNNKKKKKKKKKAWYQIYSGLQAFFLNQ